MTERIPPPFGASRTLRPMYTRRHLVAASPRGAPRARRIRACPHFGSPYTTFQEATGCTSRNPRERLLWSTRSSVCSSALEARFTLRRNGEELSAVGRVYVEVADGSGAHRCCPGNRVAI